MQAEMVETQARVRPTCSNCKYWKDEADRAVRCREEVKASLDYVDGPAAFWRRMAKALNAQLVALSRSRQDGRGAPIHKRVEASVRKISKLVGRADSIATRSDDAKKNLWEAWSGLEDGHPLKQRLWEIWTDL